MDKNALKALADRLDRIENLDMLAREDVMQAADYLRQCAEQEPVAWGWCSSDGVVRDCIGSDTHAEQSGNYTIPLYAVPQHERETTRTESEYIYSKEDIGTAYERAAKLCESIAAQHDAYMRRMRIDCPDVINQAWSCADAIRSLAEEAMLTAGSRWRFGSAGANC